MDAEWQLAQANIARAREPLDSPDPEAIWDFVYASDHLAVMRPRREWFVRMAAESYLALWWVPAGSRPRFLRVRRL